MNATTRKLTDISYETILVDKTPRNWAKKAVGSISDLLIDMHIVNEKLHNLP